MESDSFFCQLFKRLPETLFELLGLPSELANEYEFDPVEIKKTYRLDGLFRPKHEGLPAYFLEVQFYASNRIYAGLFAKAFNYLNDNPILPDWHAVAIFENRNLEPKAEPFEDLVHSKRVTRIYLDEMPTSADAPIGIGILQLVCEKENALSELVDRLVQKVRRDIPDRESLQNVIELLEELLIRRFADRDREEIRKMFHLTDIRKTTVWREAHDEGIEKGIEKGIKKGRQEGVNSAKREMVRNCLAKQMPVNEIATLVGLPVKDVRRIAKEDSK